MPFTKVLKSGHGSFQTNESVCLHLDLALPRSRFSTSGCGRSVWMSQHLCPNKLLSELTQMEITRARGLDEPAVTRLLVSRFPFLLWHFRERKGSSRRTKYARTEKLFSIINKGRNLSSLNTKEIPKCHPQICTGANLNH